MSAPNAKNLHHHADAVTRLLVIIGLAVIVATWIVAGVSIVEMRRAAMDHARSEARNLAVAVADEIAHTLDNVAASMEIVAQRMRGAPGRFDIYDWAREIPMLAGATSQAAIIGPDGKLIGTTMDPAPEPIDLGDREHFRVHLDGKFQGLFISKPVTGRLSHQVTLQVTRRVDAADGRFLGVVMFAQSPSRLTGLSTSINLGERGIIVLTGLDNVIRARFTAENPDGLSGIGQSIAGGARPNSFPEGVDGDYVRSGVVDGITRVLHYRRINGYPLVVTVGLDLEAALAPAHTHAMVVGGFTAVSTVLLAGFAAFLIRAIRRRAADEAEMRALEAHQRDLERQLFRSQKLEALGTLAGGIAHDLNNTLVPIVTLADMLLRRAVKGKDGREELEMIVQASLRGRDLVRQILAFSRNHEPVKAPVDLAGTVRQTLDMLRATVPPSIKLEESLDPIPPILADAGQIQQVVLNLVTNAVHAIGKAKGIITVALSLDAAGGSARLRVSDTGCGMDAKTVERIFEPFFTTASVGEGTGLGLSVVHGIVSGHGGSIDVQTKPGEGTTFRVLLPVPEAAAPRAAA